MKNKVHGAPRSSKMAKTLREYREGTLKTGGGDPVNSHTQAVAIGLAQARKMGKK